MSRGGILWRRVLVAIVAVAATSCTSIRSTTNFKVTIRVDGRDYTSEVVGQMRKDGFSGKSFPHPYGRVMTFRLPDDRVVVLGVYNWGAKLRCVPRLDQSDTGCKARWPYSNSHLEPDGYVFNSATNPTSAEAFQFEPRDPEFAAKGRYDLRRGITSVPLSNLVIEMVNYAQSTPWVRGPRDTLDRDFPGYELTRNRDGMRVSETNPALNEAADNAGVPLARDR